MQLSAGTRLGPYEIVAAIGAGGMGEVYRARDTKLNRDVAIKVLPEVFAQDADRLARFTREAQTLASLNHPNIAHIHEMTSGVFSGVGPAEKTPDVISHALVMELVEGEDLSALIANGALQDQRALQVYLTCCRSPARSPTRSKPGTSRGSSIATSNPPTSRSARTAP